MHYIFNHVDIEIKYHDGSGEDWEGARLMSAKVTPRRYELHKQYCQGGPQWPYGPCAELDSWVKRSGFGICPVPCVLLLTMNSQCQGNLSKCWTRITSYWLELHAGDTGIKLLQESLDKCACFICSFFLQHSAWMFYICYPTWSNLVVIKVVNFKLVSVLLMDFFCLDMSLGQRKNLSSFKKPNVIHLYTVLASFTLWGLIPHKESDAWQDKISSILTQQSCSFYSIKHEKGKDLKCDGDLPAMGFPAEIKSDVYIAYTYSVQFLVSLSI